MADYTQYFSDDIKKITGKIREQLISTGMFDEPYILPLSADFALKAKQDKDDAALDYSNFASLLEYIQELLSHRTLQIKKISFKETIEGRANQIYDLVNQEIEKNKIETANLHNLKNDLFNSIIDLNKSSRNNLEIITHFFNNKIDNIENFSEYFSGVFSSIKESFTSNEEIFSIFQNQLINVDEIKNIFQQVMISINKNREKINESLSFKIGKYDIKANLKSQIMKFADNITTRIANIPELTKIEPPLIKNIVQFNSLENNTIGQYLYELSLSAAKNRKKIKEIIEQGINSLSKSMNQKIAEYLHQNEEIFKKALDETFTELEQDTSSRQSALINIRYYIRGFLDASKQIK